MKSEQIEAGLVVNEWQLGKQLNVALANGTRDKFNLLLSLLSDDARDFSQFDIPKATQASLSQVELRDSLNLAPQQPLINEGISLKQAEKLSLAIQRSSLCDVRLQYMLNNEAILSRYQKSDIEPDITDNLSFLSQTRLKHAGEERERQPSAKGVDHALMAKYEALKLSEKPLKVNYI
ncbi:hypothetical protein CW745_01345 [Psychromonas sp. psych-6C06]|uniref:VC2046/SO_2500 family protein n=1 Tax=Psychromonas sp. psych-6C06 TaxID=2058089 RepID=UPI000C3330B7|nr:VC2046/SO_2500 family protein [Psychromonas sp. psych-6C06]PKF63524.1 hypothetical protein CW745_01345 [Psychromonas sp. psych-6C06]